jgi:uncharacterized protein
MAQPTMTGAVQHPLVQKILNYQLAMARGDIESGRTVFDPDVEYTVPGNNALSGTTRGPDLVMGYFGKLMQATAGTYEITKMNWLVSGTKVLLETVNHAKVNGKELTWDEAILFEFRNGLKWRIEMFQADQAGVDAFFGQ